MKRVFFILDLSMLRGPARDSTLQQLAVAIARCWGVYHQADLTWGYAAYDSTCANLLLRDRLRKTAASLSLPPVFHDCSCSDLKGSDLPSFVALIDKLTDEEYQSQVVDRRSKLAQLQQPGGIEHKPFERLVSALQAAVGGSFLRKLKELAEHSSGSGSFAEALILLFTPALATLCTERSFLGLYTATGLMGDADPVETKQEELVRRNLASALQQCWECCARLAWVVAEPPMAAGQGEEGADSAGEAAIPTGLVAAVNQGRKAGEPAAVVLGLGQAAAASCMWDGFGALLGLAPVPEQAEVATAAGEQAQQAQQQRQQQRTELNADVWPGGEDSAEAAVGSLKVLLAHLEVAHGQGGSEDIRRRVRQRHREQQRQQKGREALPAGLRRPGAGPQRAKGQAAVDHARKLHQEKENRRNGSQPNTAPGSTLGCPSQVLAKATAAHEEEVESCVVAMPLDQAAEELARGLKEYLESEQGNAPRPAEMACRIKQYLVDPKFAAACKYCQQQEGGPSTDQIRSMLLSRAAAPAAALKLEFMGCRDSTEQLEFQRKCVAHVLLRLHISGAGVGNGQELGEGDMSELEGLLQLVSATLHPIPKAGYDFFNGVIRSHFGAKFPGPLQRLARELWEEDMDVDLDAVWEQAMAKDIGMEVSGETPGTHQPQQQPSTSAAAGATTTLSGNPQRSGSVRTNDTGGRQGPSLLGRQVAIQREVSMREIVTSTRPSLATGPSASQSKFSGDNSGVHTGGGSGGGQWGATSKAATSKPGGLAAREHQLRMRALALGQNNSWQFAAQRQDKNPAARAAARGPPNRLPQHISSRGAAQVAKAKQQQQQKGPGKGAAAPSQGAKPKPSHQNVPDTPETHIKLLPNPLRQQQQQEEEGGDVVSGPVGDSPSVLGGATAAETVPNTDQRPPLINVPQHLAGLRRAPSSRQLQFQGLAAAARTGAPGVIPSSQPQDSPEPVLKGDIDLGSPLVPAGPTWLVAATQQSRGGGLMRQASARAVAQPLAQLLPTQQPVQQQQQQQPALPSQQTFGPGDLPEANALCAALGLFTATLPAAEEQDIPATGLQPAAADIDMEAAVPSLSLNASLAEQLPPPSPVARAAGEQGEPAEDKDPSDMAMEPADVVGDGELPAEAAGTAASTGPGQDRRKSVGRVFPAKGDRIMYAQRQPDSGELRRRRGTVHGVAMRTGGWQPRKHISVRFDEERNAKNLTLHRDSKKLEEGQLTEEGDWMILEDGAVAPGGPANAVQSQPVSEAEGPSTSMNGEQHMQQQEPQPEAEQEAHQLQQEPQQDARQAQQGQSVHSSQKVKNASSKKRAQQQVAEAAAGECEAALPTAKRAKRRETNAEQPAQQEMDASAPAEVVPPSSRRSTRSRPASQQPPSLDASVPAPADAAPPSSRPSTRSRPASQQAQQGRQALQNFAGGKAVGPAATPDTTPMTRAAASGQHTAGEAEQAQREQEQPAPPEDAVGEKADAATAAAGHAPPPRRITRAKSAGSLQPLGVEAATWDKGGSAATPASRPSTRRREQQQQAPGQHPPQPTAADAVGDKAGAASSAPRTRCASVRASVAAQQPEEWEQPLASLPPATGRRASTRSVLASQREPDQQPSQQQQQQQDQQGGRRGQTTRTPASTAAQDRQPHEEPVKYREEIVGRKVEVFWDGMKKWYPATIVGYNHGRHFLQYMDGERKWEYLFKEKYRFCDGPAPQPPAAAAERDTQAEQQEEVEVEGGAAAGHVSAAEPLQKTRGRQQERAAAVATGDMQLQKGADAAGKAASLRDTEVGQQQQQQQHVPSTHARGTSKTPRKRLAEAGTAPAPACCTSGRHTPAAELAGAAEPHQQQAEAVPSTITTRSTRRTLRLGEAAAGSGQPTQPPLQPPQQRGQEGTDGAAASLGLQGTCQQGGDFAAGLAAALSSDSNGEVAAGAERPAAAPSAKKARKQRVSEAQRPAEAGPTVSLRGLVNLGCSSCAAGKSGCAICYQAAAETLTGQGLGFLLTMPMCPKKCTRGQPRCPTCWEKLGFMLEHPNWTSSMPHCDSHAAFSAGCQPCRAEASAALGQQGAKLQGCSKCKQAAKGCADCWQKLHAMLSQLASHHLVTGNPAPAAEAEQPPNADGPAPRATDVPAGSAPASRPKAQPKGKSSKRGRAVQQLQQAAADQGLPAGQLEGKEAAVEAVMAVGEHAAPAGTAHQGGAPELAPVVAAQPTPGRMNRQAAGAVHATAASEPGVAAASAQRPAKRQKAARKGRMQEQFAPAADARTAGAAGPPPGELQQPAAEQGMAEAEMAQAQAPLRMPPPQQELCQEPSQPAEEAKQEQQPVPQPHQQGQGGEKADEGTCTMEPAPKKQRLPTTSQVTAKTKTPRKKGVLVGMRATSKRTQGGSGIDEEVNQRPRSTFSRAPAAAAVAASPAAARTLSPAAASKAAQYNCPAAQLARRASLGGLAAQQASPYSGTYGMPGSPTASAGGSVGEAPGAAAGRPAQPDFDAVEQQQAEAARDTAGAYASPAPQVPALPAGPAGGSSAENAKGLSATREWLAANPLDAPSPIFSGMYGGGEATSQGSEDVLSQYTSRRQGGLSGMSDCGEEIESGPHEEPAAEQEGFGGEGGAAGCVPEAQPVAADTAGLPLPTPDAGGPEGGAVPAAAQLEAFLVGQPDQGERDQLPARPAMAAAAEAAASAPAPAVDTTGAPAMSSALPAATTAPASAPLPAAAASALPLLSPFEMGGAATTAARPGQQGMPHARPAGRLTEGKAAAGSGTAAAVAVAGAPEISPREGGVATASARQDAGTPSSVAAVPHEQPPPASLQHHATAVQHRRNSVDSATLLPMSEQQRQAAAAQHSPARHLTPLQLFRDARASPRPAIPHWQRNCPPQQPAAPTCVSSSPWRGGIPASSPLRQHQTLGGLGGVQQAQQLPQGRPGPLGLAPVSPLKYFPAGAPLPPSMASMAYQEPSQDAAALLDSQADSWPLLCPSAPASQHALLSPTQGRLKYTPEPLGEDLSLASPLLQAWPCGFEGYPRRGAMVEHICRPVKGSPSAAGKSERRSLLLLCDKTSTSTNDGGRSAQHYHNYTALWMRQRGVGTPLEGSIVEVQLQAAMWKAKQEHVVRTNDWSVILQVDDHEMAQLEAKMLGEGPQMLMPDALLHSMPWLFSQSS